MDDDDEDEWRDADDNESIDSEGRPRGTCHRDSQHIQYDIYYPLCAKGELDDDDEDEWRDGDDSESSDSEGKAR